MAGSTIMIQLKRGLDAARRLITPASGEPLITTDADHLGGFATIGDGATAGGLYPGAGNVQPGWILNTWYMGQMSLLNPATAAASRNIVFYTPICVPPNGSLNFKSISVNVIGAGTGGSLARLGVYDNVNGVPTNLLYDSGDITMTSTGLRSPAAGFNLPLKPGWYWLAFTTNSTSPTFSTLSTVGFLPLIGFTVTSTLRPNVFFQVRTFAALPDPAVVGGNAFGGTPLVFLQAGS